MICSRCNASFSGNGRRDRYTCSTKHTILMMIKHCFACRSLLRHCNFSINGCINHKPPGVSFLSRFADALLRREGNLQLCWRED